MVLSKLPFVFFRQLCAAHHERKGTKDRQSQRANRVQRCGEIAAASKAYRGVEEVTRVWWDPIVSVVCGEVCHSAEHLGALGPAVLAVSLCATCGGSWVAEIFSLILNPGGPKRFPDVSFFRWRCNHTGWKDKLSWSLLPPLRKPIVHVWRVVKACFDFHPECCRRSSFLHML